MAKRAFVAAGAIAALAVSPVLAQGETPDVQEIVNKASAAAYYQGEDGRAKVHMSIKDAQGRERTRDFIILRKDIDDVDNGEQRFYVFFERSSAII